MNFLNDLVFDVTFAGERMVIPNLTGLKCTKRGEQAFDSAFNLKSTKMGEKSCIYGRKGIGFLGAKGIQ